MINLHYIRAAVEANTGVRLTFPELRKLLVEEGLITKRQADADARDFNGYGALYGETYEQPCEVGLDMEMGLPENPIIGERSWQRNQKPANRSL